MTLCRRANTKGVQREGASKAAVERALRIQRLWWPRTSPRHGETIRPPLRAEVIAVARQALPDHRWWTGAAAGGRRSSPGSGTASSLATGRGRGDRRARCRRALHPGRGEVHGLRIEEVERPVRWCLRSSSVRRYQAHAEGHRRFHTVAKQLADVLPLPKLGPLNQILVRWFVKRYATRQARLLSAGLPLGVGVVIGAVGNVATARAVIRSTERAFGPPPTAGRTRWPLGQSRIRPATLGSARSPDRSPTRQVARRYPVRPLEAPLFDASIDPDAYLC